MSDTNGFTNPFGAAAPAGGGDGGGGNKKVMGPAVLPPSPNWEPIETGDFLEQNGYFTGKISAEKAAENGVWLTFDLEDEDSVGKRVQMLLGDFTADPKKEFRWRELIYSITGSKVAAQQGLQYNPGMFVGQTSFFKTSSYADKKGENRTGVDKFVTKSDYETAVKSGKHRWKAEIKAAAGAFALTAPGGLPAGFPVPMPPSAKPISSAPPAALSPPPAAVAAQPATFAPPSAPAPVPAPSGNPFAFPGAK